VREYDVGGCRVSSGGPRWPTPNSRERGEEKEEDIM